MNRAARLLACGIAAVLAGQAAVTHATDTAANSAAANYPTRPISIVVPYATGGTIDMMGRALADKLRTSFNTTVLVENKPGASGVMGAASVVKAAPDGHTVLLTNTALVQTPVLLGTVPYDALRDLVPLNLVSHAPLLFVVRQDLPVSSLKEFAALAAAAPGKYSLGNYGSGTLSHIHAATLTRQANLDLVHVPYRGVAPLVNDLIGGQVTAGFTDVATVAPHVQAGRLKVLGVTGSNRLPMYPNVPTVSSQGFQHFDASGWLGLFVRAGTPPDIARKLSDEFARVLDQPDVRARITAAGMLPPTIDRSSFARMVQNDAALWSRVIKASNIKVD